MSWLNDHPEDMSSSVCTSCGNALSRRDPIYGQCYQCRHARCECPSSEAKVFVLWRGIRIGFPTMAGALNYIRINREANDPSVYCGEPIDPPVLEAPADVTLAELAEKA